MEFKNFTELFHCSQCSVKCCMRLTTLPNISPNNSIHFTSTHAYHQAFARQQFYLMIIDVETFLEEGERFQADDVDSSEAEGEGFVQMISESVDDTGQGLESDEDGDNSNRASRAMEAVLLKAHKALRQSHTGKKNGTTKKTSKDTAGKKTCTFHQLQET